MAETFSNKFSGLTEIYSKICMLRKRAFCLNVYYNPNNTCRRFIRSIPFRVLVVHFDSIGKRNIAVYAF